MRVFLDSNVLVSGIVYPGTERAILLATFQGKHGFVISQDVEREVLDVVGRKFARLRDEAEEVISLLRVENVPRKAYEARLREFPGLRDPNDAHILAAAIVSRCDAIATGDRELLALREVQGVRIIRPTQARRLMSSRR